MNVHKILGAGFLESIYEAALKIEFNKSNIPFKSQVEFSVIYRSENIRITKKLIDVLATIDVKVHDHIIIIGNEYYSFADNNLI